MWQLVACVALVAKHKMNKLGLLGWQMVVRPWRMILKMRAAMKKSELLNVQPMPRSHRRQRKSPIGKREQISTI